MLRQSFGRCGRSARSAATSDDVAVYPQALRWISQLHRNVAGYTATSSDTPQRQWIHRNVAQRCGVSRGSTATPTDTPQRLQRLRCIQRFRRNATRYTATFCGSTATSLDTPLRRRLRRNPAGPLRICLLAERVLEVVGVLAAGDLDPHLAGEPRQLAGAGVRHHGDRQLRLAAVHGAAVLEHEGAGAALQR